MKFGLSDTVIKELQDVRVTVIYFDIRTPDNNTLAANGSIAIICGRFIGVHLVNHGYLRRDPQLIGKHHSAQITATTAIVNQIFFSYHIIWR